MLHNERVDRLLENEAAVPFSSRSHFFMTMSCNNITKLNNSSNPTVLALKIPVKTGLFPNSTTLRRSRFKHSSSHNVRSTFIDYFVGKYEHKFIKSSSVVPLCDPTVPFVNAGMNQFKGIFLGKTKEPCLRAVNSQKCIRVGGKHNDLNIVGRDGHHHTFFEMLGNWSFGDYYKNEACQMAWNLLLGPYGLKPENLVVTYFSGDPALGLKEDIECRDIWKSIGVKSSHIKASGASDNFWEMGPTGPCGPCTEIYYVDSNGNLTEIWNLVFIQYNREDDGTLTGLPMHHVDTGMGLERLTALLQSVPSNYDTDLFQPIIKAIEKMSKHCTPYSHKFGNSETLDNAYRCLADHSRMISVCLADGVFPTSSEDIFKCNNGMLSDLYDRVADSLGATYPELHEKRKESKIIIDYEEQSYAKLRVNLKKKWKDLIKQYPEVENFHDVELSGFADGYRHFKQAITQNKSTMMPADVIFKLYDTHGFPEHIIERIAELNNLTMDKGGFQNLLMQHKSRHKTAFKEQTDGVFETLDSDVMLNDLVSLKIDSERRLKIMRNHTGIHLLNAAIRKVLSDSVVCQMGSNVSDKGMLLYLSLYGKKISHEIVMETQNLASKIITMDLPIQTTLVNGIELSQKSKVLTVPGEIYPETGLRLVEAETDDFVSRELCCGTHLPSTGHVKDFCITLVKGAGSNSPSIQAVTGDEAVQVRDLWSRAHKLQEIVDMIEPQRLKEEAIDIQEKLTNLCGSSGKPYGEHAHCLELLDRLKKQATIKNDLALQTLAEAEMTELVDEVEKKGQKFIVHFLRCSYLMDTVYVSAALSPCDNTPALVMGCANGIIHAACRIPQSYINENFNAVKWISCILPIFKSELAPSKQDQSSLLFAAMIGTKVSLITCEQLVQDAMFAATKYADTHIVNTVRDPQHKYRDSSNEDSSQVDYKMEVFKSFLKSQQRTDDWWLRLSMGGGDHVPTARMLVCPLKIPLNKKKTLYTLT
ncbi:Alanine--tRNA ligase, mitochondrial [Eumeta japonica]|uniref:alanine--tRNA ligase n=1 Tax=Eumeta variegata TaxID=151549 RepID=A0A4C1UE74_EUMVA|nr:Alanine--tRNA ligase, mitochondrial [Eumeta japonica]